MKKIIMLVCVLGLVSGCRNYYSWDTRYDENGKVVGISGSAYESKFTRKSVNIISEVEAFKVVLADPTTAAISPEVALGWGVFALLEKDVNPGEDLVFYRESRSMFGYAITGRTLLYISNHGTKPFKPHIKSESKTLSLYIHFVKVYRDGQKTVIDIKNPEDIPKGVEIKGVATGNHELVVPALDKLKDLTDKKDKK